MTTGICYVCSVLDGDKTPKEVQYCRVCRISMCKTCRASAKRRVQALAHKAKESLIGKRSR